MIDYIDVSSLDGFVKVIDEIHNVLEITDYENSLLFRGQDKTEYNLIPGLFRTDDFSAPICVINPKEFNKKEKDLINEFIQDGHGFKPDISENDLLVWMEIAQHYGLPTRLLDFTNNPLVSLYFACKSSFENDAYVWFVNNKQYMGFLKKKGDISGNSINDEINKIISDEVTNLIPDLHRKSKGYLQFPRFYFPSNPDNRMKNQSAVFMVWAASNSAFNKLMSEEEQLITINNKININGIIGKIRINYKDKKQILKQLDSQNINEKYLFPGLDGVGKYLKMMFYLECNNILNDDGCNNGEISESIPLFALPNDIPNIM